MPDPRYPTVSWQVVEDVKDRITPLKQSLLPRIASENNNGIGIQHLRIVVRDASERFTLQRGIEER